MQKPKFYYYYRYIGFYKWEDLGSTGSKGSGWLELDHLNSSPKSVSMASRHSFHNLKYKLIILNIKLQRLLKQSKWYDNQKWIIYSYLYSFILLGAVVVLPSRVKGHGFDCWLSRHLVSLLVEIQVSCCSLPWNTTLVSVETAITIPIALSRFYTMGKHYKLIIIKSGLSIT
jgi:hypothetical protein